MNNCAFLWLFKKQEKNISERKGEFSTFTKQIGDKEGNKLLSHTAQPSALSSLDITLWAFLIV